MALKELFLYHVFYFLVSTHALAARCLRTPHLSSTFFNQTLHYVISLLLRALNSRPWNNRAWYTAIDLSKLLLICQGVRPKLLCLLFRSLLVRSHLLAHLKNICSICNLGNINPLHWVGGSLGSHVKHRSYLRRVIDDDVVDVIVIYDVCDISSAHQFRLCAFLSRDPRRRASTAHSESLTVRISCSFKSAFVFTLFGHRRVLSQLLRTSIRFFLVFLAKFLCVDEIVALFIVLTLLALALIGFIWADNTSLAVAQVALSR